MNLDFTGLDSISQEKQAPKKPQNGLLTQEEYKSTSAGENALQGQEMAVNGTGHLQREADQKKDAISRAAEVYKRYQHNIKVTETLQAEILKGVKAGEDVAGLFLKAAKALSLAVSNDLFYQQIEQEMHSRQR